MVQSDGCQECFKTVKCTPVCFVCVCVCVCVLCVLCVCVCVCVCVTMCETNLPRSTFIYTVASNPSAMDVVAEV